MTNVVYKTVLGKLAETEAESSMEPKEVSVVGVDTTTSDEPSSDDTCEVACSNVGKVKSEVSGGTNESISSLTVEIGADHTLTGVTIKDAKVADSLTCPSPQIRRSTVRL